MGNKVMADLNLKIIKIFFVVVIGALVVSMVSGMVILRGAPWSWQKMKMSFDFWKYKTALARENDNAPELNTTDREFSSAVPVLLYHGVIADEGWQGDDTNISLSDFKEQMFALKKNGYQSVTFSDFSDFMKGSKQLPKNSFLLTFDDGRKDSYYPVDPVLKAVGYNAVMFVITGKSLNLGETAKNFYLNKNELREMQKSGRWELQSHGDFDHDWETVAGDGQKGHFLSNRLYLAGEDRIETEDEAKARMLNDLKNSKTKLEKTFHEKVSGFAYPFNDYGQENINFSGAERYLADNIGDVYPLTFFQVSEDDWPGNVGDKSQFFIKRIDVNSGMSPSELLDILDRSDEKKLPYADSFWEDRGWKAGWGDTKVWGDLTLSENGEGGGNQTTLLGSSGWKNYFMKSQVQIVSGNSISQIIRYLNDDNYAACNFTNTDLSLTEKINGQEIELAEKMGDFSSALQTGAEVGSEISGELISCYLNGKIEIQGKIDSRLGSGGVGFSMWDDLPAQAVVRVKKVDVLPI